MPQAVWLKQQTIFAHKRLEAKIKVLAGVMSSGLAPRLADACRVLLPLYMVIPLCTCVPLACPYLFLSEHQSDWLRPQDTDLF